MEMERGSAASGGAGLVAVPVSGSLAKPGTGISDPTEVVLNANLQLA